MNRSITARLPRVAAGGWAIGILALLLAGAGPATAGAVTNLAGQLAGTVPSGHNAEPLPILSSLPGNYYSAPGDTVDAHPGRADFSEANAADRMATVAGAVLTQLLGVDHVDRETAAPRAAVTIDQRPIRLSDLTLTEFRFVAGAEQYTTSANTFGGFRQPTDAWIAVWTRTGVGVPEWSDQPSTVTVVVVMEDGTGIIHSIHAGRGGAPE